jgi:hypothetical protein
MGEGSGQQFRERSASGPVTKQMEFAMSDTDTVLELNQQLARKINDEARKDPQSPYANKFVGIANGRVVIVADTLDEVARFLRRTESDLARTFFVEASRDPNEVVEIWSAY